MDSQPSEGKGRLSSNGSVAGRAGATACQRATLRQASGIVRLTCKTTDYKTQIVVPASRDRLSAYLMAEITIDTNSEMIYRDNQRRMVEISGSLAEKSLGDLLPEIDKDW